MGVGLDTGQWGQGSLVLLADDEPTVREVIHCALSMMGFQVLQASNGQDALTQFMEHHANIRAVILDITMPIMSGEEVLAGIQQVCPGMPAILMSGYSRQEPPLNGQNITQVSFLQKPFKLTELSKLLGKALATSAMC